MLPETEQHLRDHGFLREDNQVATGLIIDELCGLLTGRIVDTEAEIRDKAQSIQELRVAVLGDSDDENVQDDLDDRVRALLSASPSGRVQSALENGHVLCSASIERADGDGKVRVRFVTSDPTLVEMYFQAPLIKRAVSSAATLNSGLELSSRRVPALATKRWALAQQTHEQIAFQIPLQAST
jgi:hypothetical protein